MRLISTGDIHFRATAPAARRDDYVAAIFGKMKQVFKIAADHGCSYLIQPGDLVDSATVPLWLVREIILQFKAAPSVKVLCVLGQHDQRYHHGARVNTPMGLLEAAGVVTVLDKTPLHLDEALVFGASWGEPMPSLKPAPIGTAQILVTHRMVVKNEKLWDGQEEYAKASALLRNHKFDLIVTGDNHQAFIEEVSGRYLVNCGSLMRSNVNQANHKPNVVIYDTGTRKVKQIFLEVEPAQHVFAVEEAAATKAKQRDENLEAFVEQIGRNRGAPDLDFVATLKRMTKEVGASESVTKLVDEIVEEGSRGKG